MNFRMELSRHMTDYGSRCDSQPAVPKSPRRWIPGADDGKRKDKWSDF